jgi:hypothetical protein
MKKKPEQVRIEQVDNGYFVYAGSKCDGSLEQYAYESMFGVLNFLDKHFTLRNEGEITSDVIGRVHITTK